jgi:hypothetical protein
VRGGVAVVVSGIDPIAPRSSVHKHLKKQQQQQTQQALHDFVKS